MLTGQNPASCASGRLSSGRYALLIFALLVAGRIFVGALSGRDRVFPALVPPQMLAWAGRLDVAALRSTPAEGVERPAPRAPISHYHGVDQWFQPDNGNGCTLSGCHQPLPHDQAPRSRRLPISTPRFSLVRCATLRRNQRPAGTKWVSTGTKLPQAAPAILQLLEYLELNADAIQSDPAKVDAGELRICSARPSRRSGRMRISTNCSPNCNQPTRAVPSGNPPSVNCSPSCRCMPPVNTGPSSRGQTLPISAVLYSRAFPHRPRSFSRRLRIRPSGTTFKRSFTQHWPRSLPRA